MANEHSLAGRPALVCGASKGIGRAAALALAARGAEVTALARSKNALEVLVGELREAGAPEARAGFANQGQVCLCGSRILVEDSIYTEFTERLIETVDAMIVGDPSDPATQIGSLSSLAHRDEVEGYLALAKEEGGRIRCGGTRPKLPAPFDRGAFLKPAVITGLGPACRTVQEEIFGPVVTTHSFKTEEEALVLANGVRFGLAASVWTNDLGRAHRVSAALQTGMVWVNTWLLRDLRVPFGGMKDSGVGREGGRYSLEFFSESRNICIKLN